jgi:hypothetical protein
VSIKTAPLLAFLAVLSVPARSFACAACYGQSDSPLAEGMNWGILSLLAVVLVIWAGIGAAVVHFARRAARVAREQTAPALLDTTDKSQA